MVEFRRIKATLFVILLLQCTVAGKNTLSFTVRAGHDVTLPCGNVINPQHTCKSTTWIYSRDGGTTNELIAHGQIKSDIYKAISDRLHLTEECSLVIKNVTPVDAGLYTCRQYPEPGGLQQGPDCNVLLSVIDMTQDKDNDDVTLFCAVRTYECQHTVQWLYQGNQDDVEIRADACSSRVILASHLNQKLLKCSVTVTETGETLLLDACPQSSCEKTGSTSAIDWWWYVLVAVGLAALLITIVAVIRWKRAKGDRTHMDDRIAGPKEDVSYASVSYSKNNSSKAQVRSKEGDEDDVVTYSTVKAPSLSVGTFADPSNIYATIDKPNK
ncbi:uncharacterized protein LOC134877048 isoform X2 [Eleginops maclovinus]|uniref:uncharacterized protein LOC134877048 isoform X2 n=1 Tax=Eleginops maclovinus TaxID=56733 RepID=UPI00308071B4